MLIAGAQRPSSALGATGSRTDGRPGQSRTRRVLVMAQVALSLVLVVGAGLFVKTFASLASRGIGFERDRSLIVSIGAQLSGVDSAARSAEARAC